MASNNSKQNLSRKKVEEIQQNFMYANAGLAGYDKNYLKFSSKKRNIEDILVYQALRDQKKMELLMKVRELRHV